MLDLEEGDQCDAGCPECASIAQGKVALTELREVTEHCAACGLDVNLGDWEEHRRTESWNAVGNYPEMFTEVGHE